MIVYSPAQSRSLLMLTNPNYTKNFPINKLAESVIISKTTENRMNVSAIHVLKVLKNASTYNLRLFKTSRVTGRRFSRFSFRLLSQCQCDCFRFGVLVSVRVQFLIVRFTLPLTGSCEYGDRSEVRRFLLISRDISRNFPSISRKPWNPVSQRTQRWWILHTKPKETVYFSFCFNN